jgi:hypothetical protein
VGGGEAELAQEGVVPDHLGEVGDRANVCGEADVDFL